MSAEPIGERTGHPIHDAVIALAEHAYLQGRASAAHNWSDAHEQHRQVLLALADLQDLIPEMVAETTGGTSPRRRFTE